MKMIRKIVLIAILGLVILLFVLFYKLNGYSEKANLTPFAILEMNNSEFYSGINSSNIQYYPKMRFAKRNITYQIDRDCSNEERNRMKVAFQILENKTRLLKFQEAFQGFGDSVKAEASPDSPKSQTPQGFGDIIIFCNQTIENNSQGFVKAGEGGAFAVIDTGSFNIIKSGRITLFNNSVKCSEPLVELHELLHVLGFKHAVSNTSIMYNISYCNQELTEDILGELVRVYGVEELPDLDLVRINSSKHEGYLNFKAEVINKGLKNSEQVKLEVYSNDIKVKSFELGKIEFGAGKILQVDNFFVKDYDRLVFVLAGEKELDDKNNKKGVYL